MEYDNIVMCIDYARNETDIDYWKNKELLHTKYLNYIYDIEKAKKISKKINLNIIKYSKAKIIPTRAGIRYESF